MDDLILSNGNNQQLEYGESLASHAALQQPMFSEGIQDFADDDMIEHQDLNQAQSLPDLSGDLLIRRAEIGDE